MLDRLAVYFEFARLGTNWRQEILAGITTFVTMAYIVFVNSTILGDAGMPVTAVMAATCASAGFASILMGAFARYPIALAPGMGLNAYFAYAVVKGMGVPWQVALGAVFLSGVAFMLLTLAGIREKLFTSLPHELYPAVAVGIGLFIAFIGFRNTGLIVADPATTVTLGNMRNPTTLLAAAGLLIMAALQARGVRAAILFGILTITAASAALGLTQFTPRYYSLSEITATAFQLDIGGALRLGLLEILFVFLFVDLFDNLGTLVAVSKKAGLMEADGRIPRINRILLTDATATMVGACAGTSTVVSYIESTAGIVAGGRSGVTSIVTGFLFLILLFLAPLAGAIPAAATGPALILVGAAMLSHVSEIDWENAGVAIPAFLTLTVIPLSFSIANGLAVGFTSYAFIRLLTGRAREVSWLVWVLAALFIARFAYLSRG
ncbi:MAG: NCS2 family permease [Bryobacterales bacterium]|nr:NCS2 family permease [Bryobacterales bacterium]